MDIILKNLTTGRKKVEVLDSVTRLPFDRVMGVVAEPDQSASTLLLGQKSNYSLAESLLCTVPINAEVDFKFTANLDAPVTLEAYSDQSDATNFEFIPLTITELHISEEGVCYYLTIFGSQSYRWYTVITKPYFDTYLVEVPGLNFIEFDAYHYLVSGCVSPLDSVIAESTQVKPNFDFNWEILENNKAESITFCLLESITGLPRSSDGSLTYQQVLDCLDQYGRQIDIYLNEARYSLYDVYRSANGPEEFNIFGMPKITMIAGNKNGRLGISISNTETTPVKVELYSSVQLPSFNGDKAAPKSIIEADTPLDPYDETAYNPFFYTDIDQRFTGWLPPSKTFVSHIRDDRYAAFALLAPPEGTRVTTDFNYIRTSVPTEHREPGEDGNYNTAKVFITVGTGAEMEFIVDLNDVAGSVATINAALAPYGLEYQHIETPLGPR